jgi:glucan biosynthesis protein C
MTSQADTIEKAGASIPTIGTKATARPRLLYIDNLRILLTILVVLHHTAITYGASGDWFFRDPGQISEVSTILMTFFVAINQSYFMGFFFLISSYFTPGSYDRKGAGPYLRDRFIRLGIPLVFYVLVIGALVSYTLAVNLRGFTGSLLAY